MSRGTPDNLLLCACPAAFRAQPGAAPFEKTSAWFRFPAVDLTWRVEPIETIVTLSLVRYEIQPLANIGLIGSFASIVEGFGVTTAAAA